MEDVSIFDYAYAELEDKDADRLGFSTEWREEREAERINQLRALNPWAFWAVELLDSGFTRAAVKPFLELIDPEAVVVPRVVTIDYATPLDGDAGPRVIYYPDREPEVAA
jgi:hypothetical protein